MTYRYMRKVHALGLKHLANPHNPPYLCCETPPARRLAYRTALCGQTGYVKEGVKGFQYYDQFDKEAPFVSWRKPGMVTCASCLRIMRN